MEVIYGGEIPLWVTLLTWVVTVGVGVVLYKYLNLWLNFNTEKRGDIMAAYDGMRERIEKLERDKDDTNTKIFELMRELAEYKTANAMQQGEIQRLTKTIEVLQAQIGSGYTCPFIETNQESVKE